MVSTRSVLRLLHTLIKATGAKRFLDIGVFTGCSSLAAALALPDDGRVVGLDVSMEFAKIGMPFWKEAAVDHKIDVRVAPASESLGLLREQKDRSTTRKYSTWQKTEQHPQNYMVSTRSVLRLLHTLIKATGAKRFLDIGVFTGCSSLAAALALPDDGRVIGLDVSMEFAKIGMPFWKEAAVDHKIDVRVAPASESLDLMIKNGETFDMIFIDADKEGYLEYFKKSLKILKKNGIVAVDNPTSLFDDDVNKIVVSSDDVRDFSGVVEDDKVYQVYWAGDARTKGSFYDAKVLYMAGILPSLP
ncbi:hypothetical protein ISCGN_010307 [Ixodes scapularis]